mgnify:CR=1 FL=1
MPPLAISNFSCESPAMLLTDLDTRAADCTVHAVLQAVARTASIPLDVHLMIERP